jgi:hypothetical protein
MNTYGAPAALSTMTVTGREPDEEIGALDQCLPAGRSLMVLVVELGDGGPRITTTIGQLAPTVVALQPSSSPDLHHDPIRRRENVVRALQYVSAATLPISRRPAANPCTCRNSWTSARDSGNTSRRFPPSTKT